MEVNPYAPPQANLHVPSQNSEVETIRREHLNTEGNLQTVGGLYIFGAILMLLSLISMFPDMGSSRVEGPVLIVLLVLGIVYGAVGLSLRKLKPGSRWPATGISLLGLLGFPIGTVISLYSLYVLHSKRGKYVLSLDYQAIRDATPHIKRKTSRVLLIILGVLLLLLACVIIWGVLL